MDLVTVAQALPFLLKANIAPNLVGPPGIGKTSIINEFARAGGHKLFRLNLGNQDVGDIIGLADFLKNDKGEAIATKFMMPQWALDLGKFAKANPDRYAIVFLDEINRASRRDVLQAIFPLILEKRIHTTQLPPNTRIIAAMNPGNEDDFVAELGEALLSRFCHLKVTTALPSFLAYGRVRGLDPRVLEFLEDRPQLLCKSVEFSTPTRAPDQRAWEMVSDLLAAEPPEGLILELCSGIVGVEAAAAAVKFFAQADIFKITAEDVLNKFDAKLKKKLTDAIYPKNKQPRLELMSRVSEDLLTYLKKAAEENVKISADQKANLAKYVATLPSDAAFSLLSSLGVAFGSTYLEAMKDNQDIRRLLKEANDAATDVRTAVDARKKARAR